MNWKQVEQVAVVLVGVCVVVAAAIEEARQDRLEREYLLSRYFDAGGGRARTERLVGAVERRLVETRSE
jgi:hypothetical protein